MDITDPNRAVQKASEDTRLQSLSVVLMAITAMSPRATDYVDQFNT